MYRSDHPGSFRICVAPGPAVHRLFLRAPSGRGPAEMVSCVPPVISVAMFGSPGQATAETDGKRMGKQVCGSTDRDRGRRSWQPDTRASEPGAIAAAAEEGRIIARARQSAAGPRSSPQSPIPANVAASPCSPRARTGISRSPAMNQGLRARRRITCTLWRARGGPLSLGSPIHPSELTTTKYIARPMAATRQSDHPWKWHNRNRHRYGNHYRDRNRHRHCCAADINTEASDHALFSKAMATAIPMPVSTVIPWC